MSDKEKIRRHLGKIAYNTKDLGFRKDVGKGKKLHWSTSLVPLCMRRDVEEINCRLAAGEKLESFHPFLREGCEDMESEND